MNMVRDLYTPVIPQVILCSLAGWKIYAFFIGNSLRSQSSSAHQGQIRRRFIWVGVNAVAYLCTFVHNSNKAQAVFSPQRFEAYQFAAQQKIQLFLFLFPPPCAAGSIHSWLFRLREINQVAPCGPPTNLESLEKIKICATKLKKILFGVLPNPL